MVLPVFPVNKKAGDPEADKRADNGADENIGRIVFADIYLGITDKRCPKPEPAPSPAVDLPDREIPESGKPEMIGGMIGWHGIQPPAIDETPQVYLELRIVTGSRPVKKWLQDLGGETIGDGKGRQAQQDKSPGLVLTGTERVIYHENVEWRPGQRFAYHRHQYIEHGMIRIVLHNHEQDFVEMIQPLKKRHRPQIKSFSSRTGLLEIMIALN